MRLRKIKYFALNGIVGVVAWLFLAAGISNVISPFFMAFVFALFYIEEDVFKYIFGVTIARILYQFSWISVVVATNFLLVVVVFKIIQYRTKKSYKMGVILLFLILVKLNK